MNNGLDIFDRLDAGERIDDLMPYDLSGYSNAIRIQLYALYATYGEDPARRALCRRKWHDILEGRLTDESRTDSV